MKAVLLGGTRGIGRAIAQQLAERGDTLFLLGRDSKELEKSAADLQHRGAATPVAFGSCDLLFPDQFNDALNQAHETLGGFDTVILTAGSFATEEELDLESNIDRVQHLLTVNFTNTVIFCEAARKKLLAGGGGTLCVISSLAGDRGRKPIVLYGASKAGLSAYLEGLDHRYYHQGLRTICVKPGFVKTSMTAHLKPPPFANTPEQVARRTIQGIDREIPIVYSSTIWQIIIYIIRMLPRAIMRRIHI